jgi:hypothetical protein
MKKPGICLIATAIGIALGTGTIAQSMSKEEHAARREGINVEYQSSRSGCDSHSGNARAVCMAEAMGRAKIAKAELEALYKPGPTTLYKARIARSDAAYSVAWQRCNELAGTLKNVCIQKARSAETIAMAGAKAEMKISRANAIAAEKSAKAHRKARANTYGERLEADKEATVARVEANNEAADARKNAETIRREAAYAVEKEKCEAFAGDVKVRCLADAKRRYGKS